MVLGEGGISPFPVLKEQAQEKRLPFGTTVLPRRTYVSVPGRHSPVLTKGADTHPQATLPHMVPNNPGALYPKYQPILHSPALALEHPGTPVPGLWTHTKKPGASAG